MPTRPPASVVVPFLGSDRQLEALLERLRRLATRPGDELIVADNGAADRGPSATPKAGSAIRLYPAGGVRAPGFARNRGAAVAQAEWLVFIDADTEPDADLLDAYFAPPPGPRTAVLGGGIVDVLPEPADPSPALAARHLVARAHMGHERTLGRPDFPYAQSANCAILRRAFIEVGGFEESVRAAEDADLCFRLGARGWELEVRPAAVVRHHARSTGGQALAQLARHGAGAAWCNRRHPGSFPAPGPAELAARLGRSGLRAAARAARGDREGAAFAAFEVLEASAFEIGRLLPNRARR